MSTVEWLGTPPAAIGRVEWLGNVGVGVIPARCWEMPGFKDCHARQWERARAVCDPAFGGRADFMGYGTVGTCITAMANEFAEVECVPQFCATGTRVPPPGASEMPWGIESDATKQFQIDLNNNVRQSNLDYCLIKEDGKLGGDTCGLAQALDNDPNAVFSVQIPTSCQSFNTPAMCPKGGGPPPPPPPPPPVQCPPGQQLNPATNLCEQIPAPTSGTGKSKTNWGLALLGGAAVVAAAFALGG